MGLLARRKSVSRQSALRSPLTGIGLARSGYHSIWPVPRLTHTSNNMTFEGRPLDVFHGVGYLIRAAILRAQFYQVLATPGVAQAEKIHASFCAAGSDQTAALRTFKIIGVASRQ